MAITFLIPHRERPGAGPGVGRHLERPGAGPGVGRHLEQPGAGPGVGGTLSGRGLLLCVRCRINVD